MLCQLDFSKSAYNWFNYLELAFCKNLLLKFAWAIDLALLTALNRLKLWTNNCGSTLEKKLIKVVVLVTF